MSTPEEYSPTLFYLHRMLTWHGLYFGRVPYGRLARLDCALITFQIIYGVTLLYKVVNVLADGSFLPIDVNGHAEVKDFITIMGDLKPISRTIFKLGPSLFFFARLNLQIMLVHKGLEILETMNNHYFHYFDVQTRFVARMRIIVELVTWFLLLLHLGAIWTAFGVTFDVQNIVVVVSFYMNARQQGLTLFLQWFVFRASFFWLARLEVQAASSSLTTTKCLRCTRQFERVLHHFTTIYHQISRIIFIEFVGTLAFGLFQVLFALIRTPPARMFLILYGNVTWNIVTYLVIFYHHYRIKSCFINLHFILSKRSSRFSVIRRAKQANLVVGVHLLGLDVDRETPPTLCGLLSFHHANIINITIFLVETSIVLYQTEYM